MNLLISMDDTDSLDSPGTGELAAEIARMIHGRGWGETSFITRHQLYVHPEIPYTSHNSAMCFAAKVEPDCREVLIADAGDFLVRHSAPGSDPGLCVVDITAVADTAAMESFGRTAKNSVLTKQAAYDLARRLGIHLSEHGGTGQGVIGALAGAGLRLSGNDGRIRGNLLLPNESRRLSVKSLLAIPEVEAVQTRSGETLPDEQEITLDGKVKMVLMGGRATVLVTADSSNGGGSWRSVSKHEIKCY
ncbi:MAG: hypothetical protein NTX56_07025 [Proteobacteria bacterium]|nr:hypothetical protein [Pseudomonadota bacterium]